ncbi:MAG: TatD family hydrolase, partial [Polynucleobacter sp.]
ATYERALQIRRLIQELPIDAIVTETDSPDIPPAWLRSEQERRNEPAFLPRIARVLAEIRGVAPSDLAHAVVNNVCEVLPRWKKIFG